MDLAFDLGADYGDLASFDNSAAEQLMFVPRFLKRNLKGLINFGIGPGLTNLMAAKLIRGLNECIVRIFVAEQTDCDNDISLWSPQLALDEAISPVPLFGNGYAGIKSNRKPFSISELYRFPEPIGQLLCYLLNENEGLTLQGLPNIRSVETKIGGSDIERLKKIADTYREKSKKKKGESFLKKISAFFQPPPVPKQVIEMIKKGRLKESKIAVAIEVVGQEPKTYKKITRKAFWQSPDLAETQKEYPGRTPVAVWTGKIAALAVERLIASKEIKPGVWPPESLGKKDREYFFEELARLGAPVLFET